jgi:CRISPR-associated endonuclease Csn1
MPRIFGLDIGTTSVGWAVIDWDDGIAEGQVIKLGVRIFPEGTVPVGQKRESRNRARRDARLLRRQLRRRKQRRKDVGHLLTSAGLLPPFGTAAWHDAMASDPYEARSRGLNAPLTPFECGRASTI